MKRHNRIVHTNPNNLFSEISMDKDTLKENFLLWDKELTSKSNATQKALLLFDYGKFKATYYTVFPEEKEKAICLIDGIKKMQEAVMNLREIINNKLFPEKEKINLDDLCSGIIEYLDRKEKERLRLPEHKYIISRNRELKQLACKLSFNNWEILYRNLGKFADLVIDRLNFYLK